MLVVTTCEACHEPVRGIITRDGYTGGFYMRGWLPVPGGQTSIFPEGKNIICDWCMQTSEAYQRVYGFGANHAQPRKGISPMLDGEVSEDFDSLCNFIKTGKFSPNERPLSRETETITAADVGDVSDILGQDYDDRMKQV